MSSRRRQRLPRIERAAQERRERAHAHLRRVRSRADSSRRRWQRRRVQAVLGITSLAAGVVLGGPLLRAATHSAEVGVIHVEGARQLTPQRIAEATGLEAHAALGSIDAAQIAALLRELPWIQEARAVRLPLGPLVVGVEERVAVALARAGEVVAFVDASGTPFAAADAEADAALPRILLAESFELGAPDARLMVALDLAYRLPELGLSIPEEVAVAADADPQGYSLRLPGLAAPIVLGRDALQARLDDLARLLAAGLPEVGSAELLDLRFADRAVLRSASSRGGATQVAPTRGNAAASATRPSG